MNRLPGGLRITRWRGLQRALLTRTTCDSETIFEFGARVAWRVQRLLSGQ